MSIHAADLPLILEAAHAEEDYEKHFLEACYQAAVEECENVLGPRDESPAPAEWTAEMVARVVSRYWNRGDGARIDPPHTSSFIRQKFQ